MILLVLSALADEPTVTRPVVDPAIESTCPTRGLRANTPFTPPCDGVALSLAKAKWYAEMAEYADLQSKLLTLSVARCEERVELQVERADYYKGLATTKAPPSLSAPAWFALGAGTGVATVLLGALAVRAVSEVELTTP